MVQAAEHTLQTAWTALAASAGGGPEPFPSAELAAPDAAGSLSEGVRSGESESSVTKISYFFNKINYLQEVDDLNLG
jgi:hypothetical protein